MGRKYFIDNYNIFDFLIINLTLISKVLAFTSVIKSGN